MTPPVIEVRPLQRVVCYALAAVSFLLVIIAIIVPMVPATPFVLLTSYFLVRASPELNQRLLTLPYVGPIAATGRNTAPFIAGSSCKHCCWHRALLVRRFGSVGDPGG